MSYAPRFDLTDDNPVAYAAESERAAFIRKTYSHLLAAVLLFVALEYFFLQSDTVVFGLLQLVGIRKVGPLLLLGLFMGASWLARHWAHNSTNLSTQYLGLALYTVAEALIFVPLMVYATHVGGPNAIATAGLLTIVVFAGLTAIVLITGANLSGLGGILSMMSLVAFGAVIGGMLFGFSLGLWFSCLMVVLASGAILHSTSNIMHEYRSTQYVGAALELFAAVALLFWYVLRIVSSRGDD